MSEYEHGIEPLICAQCSRLMLCYHPEFTEGHMAICRHITDLMIARHKAWDKYIDEMYSYRENKDDKS